MSSKPRKMSLQCEKASLLGSVELDLLTCMFLLERGSQGDSSPFSGTWLHLKTVLLVSAGRVVTGI